MKFLNTTLILAFLQPSFAADSLVPTKRNLRPPELKPAGDHKKEEAIKKDEKKTFMEPCIALVEDIQYEGGVSDEIMTCETSSGNIYDIDAPKGWMKDHIKKDHIMTGNMEIALDKVDGIVNNKVIFKNGAMPKLELKKNNRNDKRRKLAIVTGEKTVLVVRVVSNNGTGPSTSSNEESVSNKVFGNDIDPVNLASQYKACSHGKLNIIKAPDRTGKSTSISNGVVTVTVSTTTGEGDVAMRNAITNELNSEFDVSHPTELADHAMYCLPPETMGGIAYAFINSWMSVYSDEWCNSVSAQMHEIGHNLNMAHANENGVTYTDQSGMMGYSYSSDDGPIMCFNAAKSWQFGWYDDRHIVLSTSNPTYEGQLVGIADYSPSSAPVLVKLNTATSTDYYVNFNRKTGINSGTVEAGNQVTVVEQGGEGTGYAESSLKAKLGNGGIYTISNFDGSGQDATIVVNSINTNVNPGFANVSICIGPCTSPTPIPVNLPTSSPVVPPTLQPVTSAPVPVSCTDMAVELELLTDNYGGETSWQLKENNSVVQSGSGYLSTTTYNIDLGCRTASEYNRFEFIINDSYGDGICCSYGTGSYKLKANGDIMKEGGEFTTSESFSFPVDPNPPTPAPVPVGSTKPFKLELRTDYWGYETSWLLTASDGSEYSGSNYNNNLLYTVEHLLPGNGCHTFTMNDSYGDGIYFGWYKLYWDGVVVHNVIGNFGLQEISTFGTGCVLSTELHSNGPIKVREPPNDAGATVKPPV